MQAFDLQNIELGKWLYSFWIWSNLSCNILDSH